jgi:hypothetical protein
MGAATLMATTSEAEAQGLVDDGTRPMWAALQLGPAFNLDPGFGAFFKLEQEFGYHFSGDNEGPALGGMLAESFGFGAFALQVGPKFWWDIKISDMAIYITPHAMLGYGGFFGGGAEAHTFNWEFGAEGRVILGDRFLLSFRPVGIDFFAGDGGLLVNYNLMFGGGVTF